MKWKKDKVLRREIKKQNENISWGETERFPLSQSFSLSFSLVLVLTLALILAVTVALAVALALVLLSFLSPSFTPP